MSGPLPRHVAEEACAILVALKRTVPPHLYVEHMRAEAEAQRCRTLPHTMI